MSYRKVVAPVIDCVMGTYGQDKQTGSKLLICPYWLPSHCGNCDGMTFEEDDTSQIIGQTANFNFLMTPEYIERDR